MSPHGPSIEEYKAFIIRAEGRNFMNTRTSWFIVCCVGISVLPSQVPAEEPPMIPVGLDAYRYVMPRFPSGIEAE